MLQKVLSYLWPVLVLGGAAFLLYRVDRKVDKLNRSAPTQKVQQETRVVKKVVVEKRSSPTAQVDNAQVQPIIRIRSYKPKVRPTLRWWERKVITPVAITLTKKDNLERFHAVLNRQVAMMKDCPKLGNHICIPRITVMRMSIDRFLNRMMQTSKGSLEWWSKGDNSLCWVAALTIFSNNLENLHTVIRKQLFKLGGCLVPSWRTREYDPDCAERLTKSAIEIDAYFKKIVNGHGGPLIDRNWNKL